MPAACRSPCYKQAPKDTPINRTNKGGQPMRHGDRLNLMCGAAVVAAIMLSAAPGRAQTADPNSAPNTYRQDDGWAKQPMGRGFGSTIGLQVDRDGKSMWIYD